MKNNKILEIKNLCINYKVNKQVVECLDDISFSINKGEVLGIVGESGSGKSTLAKSIIHMLSKDAIIKSGSIKFDNKEILKIKKKDIQKFQGNFIGFIFQDSMNSLNPIRKIKKQFIEILKEKKNLSSELAENRAKAALSATNLTNVQEVMNKFPFQLSGGQRQRIAIAMACALEPEILIADEPTTALDVTVQAQILRELNSLRIKNNTSIILVSHNLGVISQICDTIAVMYKGKVIEYGKVEEVLKNPKKDYTKGLINSIPTLDIDKSKRLYSINERIKL
ncbi:MAG: ABC transporter ATP-binding protein [Sarcina sp.]